MVDFFAKSKDNLELLKKWLSFSKDDELKVPFMTSLRTLLHREKVEKEDPRFTEITRRLFGNITTSENLPDLGKETDSCLALYKWTDVPYEDEELLGLEIMNNLVAWEWGAKALFA